MNFGTVWQTSKPGFWDHMWATHEKSPMTQALLQATDGTSSLCEVGCGYGHYLQAVLGRDWHGYFLGFDMCPDGVARAIARCVDAGIEHDVHVGNFLEKVADLVPFECDVAVCRDVVIHQSHWMPMVSGMLRIAPKAVIGIGYVSPDAFHHSILRPQGHYDVHISEQLLHTEAKAAGFGVETTIFYNEVRKRKEMLATLTV